MEGNRGAEENTRQQVIKKNYNRAHVRYHIEKRINKRVRRMDEGRRVVSIFRTVDIAIEAIA